MRPVRLAVLAAAALAAACAPPDTGFSVDNARAHVRHLAREIGPRPAGSDANARARTYLTSTLERFGFEVRVQAADARRPEAGLSGRVHNVIAIRRGARPEAIGIVAHYDSVAESPGAGDNGLGVATALEAARVLAQEPEPRWSLMVLLTDAEEDGLLGAAALLEDAEIRTGLKIALNLDSNGADGPFLLFETGTGNGWLASTWARAAARPRGSSALYEIYRRLPNDTDFSVLRRAGIPGLNFAAVGDTYAYHTALDGHDRLTDRALRAAGDTVVSVVHGLEREDVTRRTNAAATFFDVGGVLAVAWPRWVDGLLVSLALVFSAVAVARILRELWRHGRAPAIAATVLWTLLAIAACAASMVGLVLLLRSVREVYHPWYAHPYRLVLLLALGSATSVWILFRVSALVPAAWRMPAAASAVWLPTLVTWAACAALLARTAMPAAFLYALPLMSAAIPLAAAGPRGAPAAIAAVLAGVVSAALWLRETAVFVEFVPPLLGGAGIVTPAWVFPAIAGGGAATMLPPWLSLVARTIGRPRFTTRVLVLALAAAFAWCFDAPAYTPQRPLRVAAAQLTSPAAGGSHLVVSSSEPILELGAAASLLVPGLPESRDLRRLVRGAFVATGRVSAPAVPAAVRVDVEPAAEGIALRVRVQPHRPALLAAVMFPPGVVPIRAGIPGRVSQGRWLARYVAVPASGGLDCAFVIAQADADAAMRDGSVLLMAAGGPDAAAAAPAHPGGLPAVARASRSWFQLPLR